ncbi:Cys-tRNA(Pro) deacylase [Shewanella sp. 10N.7]|uniref:Cys-tRNA(Pro) deacylase n=1 Tax=Shewanella sp. 10N.7 TaxID=2885093 RepID=UPI001E366157|nr:Cys-tRNA(Pro) deacylase [Shewanella sp. 10N.7]MCC4832727.1 Cys-tRNA(Pro) deacylase [Shewanella sp. 10N.7]
MTPAINLAKKNQVLHQVLSYHHDPAVASYGNEALDKLKLPAEKVFKTLVVQLDTKELVVAVVPVLGMLNLKFLAKTLGVKKVLMADKALVEKTTGYVLGGVSPLAQKKRLRTVIDQSAEHQAQIFVSAGKRGLEIGLSAQDLLVLTQGVFASIAEVR